MLRVSTSFFLRFRMVVTKWTFTLLQCSIYNRCVLVRCNNLYQLLDYGECNKIATFACWSNQSRCEQHSIEFSHFFFNTFVVKRWCSLNSRATCYQNNDDKMYAIEINVVDLMGHAQGKRDHMLSYTPIICFFGHI